MCPQCTFKICKSVVAFLDLMLREFHSRKVDDKKELK